MNRRAFLALSLVSACAGAQRPAASRGPRTARDWMPLRTGAAWSYDVQTGVGEDTVLSTLSVVRVDGARFLVRSGTRTETWEHRPDGVTREGEYILKDPVRPGTTWTTRDGATVTIRGIERARRVGDTTFRDVVEVERSNPSTRITTTTWFGVDVGVVEIRARTVSSLGTATEVRSTIRGYSVGDAPAEE